MPRTGGAALPNKKTQRKVLWLLGAFLEEKNIYALWLGVKCKFFWVN